MYGIFLNNDTLFMPRPLPLINKSVLCKLPGNYLHHYRVQGSTVESINIVFVFLACAGTKMKCCVSMIDRMLGN